MIEININPIMLEEPVRISWYGVFIIAAIILGLSLALKLAKRYEVTPSQILSFFVAAFLGGIIGARLVHVVCALDFYLAHAELIPQIWLGGFSQFGMILGGLVSVVI
ncbi:prolipoprotein diacylglyceryl transferase, partial [Dehalococcoidia bacterium]|nr:prolipoprotein diacylglyceryl transferase [Dehalococcoidia bacterium]